MERGASSQDTRDAAPDFASLHPGYSLYYSLYAVIASGAKQSSP